MAVIGTFGSFTTARLGIYASQASLQVTGNNIANINTKGYTRQRADLISLYSTGTAKYANPMSVDIGYGVLVKSTTQLRDPYLDIRYRNENTRLGYYNTTLAGLNKLAQTLDEVNKGGESQNGVIENCMQEFMAMLEELSVNVGSEEYDGLVRESAKSLTTFFNTAADKLQKDWDLQKDELNDNIKEVNKCLTNIRNLNEQIRKQGIYGDNALELRDHRNLYIDELSEYLNIDVTYSMERIDQYTEIEKLTITLKDTKDPNFTDGRAIRLIDGLYGAQITIPESFPVANPNYDPEKDQTGDNLPYLDKDGNPIDDPDKAKQIPNSKFLPQVERLEDKFGRVQYKGVDTDTKKESVMIPLSDTDLNGSIQAMRELLTEEGEFASKTDAGVSYPIDDAALLARGFTQAQIAAMATDEAKQQAMILTAEGYSANDVANMSDKEKEQILDILNRAVDPRASIKKGIPYYQKRLDILAQKFASVFNDANQLAASTVYQTKPDPNDTTNNPNNDLFVNSDGTTNFVMKDGKPGSIKVSDVTIEIQDHDQDGKAIVDKDGNPVMKRVPMDSLEASKYGNPPPTEAEIKKAAEYLEILRNQAKPAEGYEFYDGGVLFSNSGNTNDPTEITAANISIAHSWASRIVRVLNTKKPDTPPSTADGDDGIKHSSRSDNIKHMITLFEQQMDYSATEIEPNAAGGDKRFLYGSFQEVYTDIGATLGSENQTIYGVASNYELMTLDLDNDRSSVSGVDLNEEATSMMQFQKSYQAACRLLTTIDSMLDTLINGTLR